jgi:hypothetical protein
MSHRDHYLSDSDSSLDGSLHNFLLARGVDLSVKDHKPSNQKFTDATRKSLRKTGFKEFAKSSASSSPRSFDMGANTAFELVKKPLSTNTNESHSISIATQQHAYFSSAHSDAKHAPKHSLSAHAKNDKLSETLSESFFETMSHDDISLNGDHDAGADDDADDELAESSQNFSADLSYTLRMLDDTNLHHAKLKRTLVQQIDGSATGMDEHAIGIAFTSLSDSQSNIMTGNPDESNMTYDEVDELLQGSILSFPASSKNKASTSAQVFHDPMLSMSQAKDSESIGTLLPSCVRLNQLLQSEGYYPMKLSAHDVDLDQR